MQFEVAVEEKRRNVLSHPVMKTLIAQKWKFMQWMFYGYLALYFLFLLSWTLLIAFPSVQQKHEYEFPKDIWRIVVEVREHFWCTHCNLVLSGANRVAKPAVLANVDSTIQTWHLLLL